MTDCNVWSGSEMKVSAELVPYYTAMVGAGVSMRLRAVQITKLVEGGNGNAKGYGFGEEEGYEQSLSETPEKRRASKPLTSNEVGSVWLPLWIRGADCRELQTESVEFEFEETKLEYTKPQKVHTYTPDFYLPKQQIFIETKDCSQALTDKRCAC